MKLIKTTLHLNVSSADSSDDWWLANCTKNEDCEQGNC